jgi:hypothetical protein
MALTITNITQATSAVVTVNATGINPFATGNLVAFAAVVGMTQINGTNGTVIAIGGSSGAFTATLNINSTTYTPYSSGGTATILTGVPISGLPTGSAIADADVFPWDQGSTTIKQPATALLAYINKLSPGEIAASVTPTNYDAPALTPERYGAVGNGTTDDTAALNTWVAVVNATTAPVCQWPYGKTYLSGPLNTITAANLTWNAYSTLLFKANSTTNFVTVTGNAPNIRGLTINGNQANFSATQSVLLLTLTGTVGGAALLEPRLEDVSVYNSPGSGLLLDTCTEGVMVNCHVDNNALFGGTFQTLTYTKFTNCTFNANGYGFQKTLATNTFAAFSTAMRFRSHHNTFVACEANVGGRDGFNQNQGSYANKFIGCLAWMNGDSGFTIASDQTGTGRPGENECCYDLEYIDCESYNNWASGLAAYENSGGTSTCYNITVLGGRYYDNGRMCGQLAQSVVQANGIYFGAGSIGISVQAKCYDDRQLCPVTGNSSGVLAATGWVAGTMGNYPRVGLYNAAMVFQGYGTITAESSGSVTVTTTPYNGVTVSSIAAGWFVTQRVQTNGCFFNANFSVGCTATATIDGFGHLQNNNPLFSGQKLMAYYLGGQNVTNLGATAASVELLSNPSWDSGVGGGVSWNYGGGSGGASNAYSTAGVDLHSPGALQLVGGTSASFYGNSVVISGGGNYVQDGWLEASCLVTAVNAGDAQLALNWTAPLVGTQTTTINHPGGGTKELKISVYVPAGSSAPILQVFSAAGKTNYFDEASLKMKFQPFDNRDYSYASRNLPV